MCKFYFSQGDEKGRRKCERVIWNLIGSDFFVGEEYLGLLPPLQYQAGIPRNSFCRCKDMKAEIRALQPGTASSRAAPGMSGSREGSV